MKFKFDLGIEVKSNISGFRGKIVARSEHLNGCNRYWIAPKIGKDAKLIDGYWFDEGELEIIGTKKIEKKNNDRGGFPSKLK